MELTPDNYFSFEADRKYMSCSQFSDWEDCELMAYCMYVKNSLKQEEKVCFTEGKFVHAYFEGKEAFKKFFNENREFITTQKGRAPNKQTVLKSEYKKAWKACVKARRQEIFMWALQGESEKIYTGEFANCLWKIRVDKIRTSKPYIFSDLKYVKSIQAEEWISCYIDDYGCCQPNQDSDLWIKKNVLVPFYERWGYFRRFAVYWKILSIATGESYIPLLPAISKEDPPDFEVFDFSDDKRILSELAYIEDKMPHILDVKSGKEKPKGCGKCKICRSKKVVTKIKKAESIFN